MVKKTNENEEGLITETQESLENSTSEDLPKMSKVPESSVQPQTQYPTDFYKQVGIFYCSSCGEKRRSKNGKIFCPKKKTATECPILKAEVAKNALQQK